MNHQKNHKENHYDFSSRKSKIFIEKIKIFVEKIIKKITKKSSLRNCPNRCQWVSKGKCKKLAKF